MTDDVAREAVIRKLFAELDDADTLLRMADEYAAGDSSKATAVLATVWENYRWLLDQIDSERRQIISLEAQVESARAYADEMAEITQYHKDNLQVVRTQIVSLRDCVEQMVDWLDIAFPEGAATDFVSAWRNKARQVLSGSVAETDDGVTGGYGKGGGARA